MSTLSVKFRFETNNGNYVPILGDTSLGPSRIASQDAGSSNPGIFYQVGGGGLNGLFATALRSAGQLTAVNQDLVTAFDAKYGAGAWRKWNSGAGSGPPPLTSFLIPLTPGVAPIGSAVDGLMYSVGPVLGPAGITDEAGYAAIYTDALNAIASANSAGGPLDGLRITMLSTGIYAHSVTNPKKLYETSAKCIIEGVLAAARADNSLAGVMILINTQDNKPISGESVGKERYGFGSAAKSGWGITVSHTGFDVPLSEPSKVQY